MDKVICIDFDGTIIEEVPFPIEGAVKANVREVLGQLYQEGYKIKIYSCRNNPSISNQIERFRQMQVLLAKYNIPYDEIILDPKPIAMYYIDDKAICFTNWEQVLKIIHANS